VNQAPDRQVVRLESLTYEDFPRRRLLSVIAGPNQGHRYHVSRVHCEIEIRGKRVLLTDLDSASGTFVNNQRVSECDLKVGDVIRIGNTQLRVDAITLAS